MNGTRILSRRRVLALAGAAALGSCTASRGATASISVGSKNFTEELILGNMYSTLIAPAVASSQAGASQAPGYRSAIVKTRLDLGGTQVAMAALRRGDIDLYPEYTGTALITVLGIKPSGTARQMYETVKREYERRFDLEWLDAAPMNDTQALATTPAIAQKYHLRTLSDLSAAAPQLRLGSIPEFTKRDDGLPGLQRAYGGFAFKEVRLFDIGLKYQALLTGKVDVVVAFGTDGQIAADRLVIFVDDKHFWPTYQVAPVVRRPTLGLYPQIATRLNALAPLLTDDVMRGLNFEVDGNKRDPADVAREFLTKHGLV